MHIEKSLISQTQLTQIIEKQSIARKFQESSLSLRGFSKSEGIPYSSLRLITKKAGKDPLSLIDQRSGNGRRSTTDDRCVTWILAYLSLNRRATISGAWRALESVARGEGWDYPTYGQVLRSIDKLPEDMRAYLVHGSKHLFEQWGLVRRKEQLRVNELWQVDATQLPVWCLDMATGEQFQPWGIGIIDSRSRVSPALQLFRESPTTGDVLLALRTAILPKHDDRLPFFGKPSKLQSDNGTIFKSADFLDALMRLGITHEPIANDCPSANGKIERFFRTLQDQLCRGLETYTHQTHGLARAKANPLPWPMVPRLVERFLAEYHMRSHRSLECSPWEAWHDALDPSDLSSFSTSDVVSACKVRVEKTVARDGIELAPGRHFSSPKLAGLVKQKVTLRVLPEGGDETVECFYRGEFLDFLERVEHNAGLVERIKSARLDRAKELARLRKSLIKEARRILPEQPGRMAGGGKPIIIQPEGGDASGDTDEPIAPDQVPTLSAENPEDE